MISLTSSSIMLDVVKNSENTISGLCKKQLWNCDLEQAFRSMKVIL